jgi:hypothetical protein
MRIFGCLSWVHIDSQRRSKLDPKAWKGALVGYDPYNSKCYRVYDPITRKVKVTSHVTFDERRSLDTYTSILSENTGTPRPAPLPQRERPIDPETEEPTWDTNKPDPVPPYPTPSSPVVSIPIDDGAPTVIPQPESDDEKEEQELHHPTTKNDSRFWSYVPVLSGTTDPATPLPSALPPAEQRNLTWTTKEPAPSSSSSRTSWCADPTCSIPTRHKAHLMLHHVYTAVEGGINDPTTYLQAIRSPQSHEWTQAMRDEYDSLVANDTWILVPRPAGANIIGGKWVYKTKLDAQGKPIRYKARYVAKGFKQVQGVDYYDTYSPVTRMTSIRTLLAIAALEDWDLESMDVDTAFLNAKVEEEVFVRQPEGFEQMDTKGRPLVCKLQKSIYGLRQASHNWNKTIDAWLRDYGFTPTKTDLCAYLKKEQEQVLMILLWVDDLIIGGSSKDIIKRFKTSISKRFKMKSLGELQWVLGMEITRDRTNRKLKMTQVTYIKQMIERFGMTDCKSISTPAEGTLARCKEQQPTDSQYMSIVGSLLYASMVTRPDITFSVQALGRHLQSSGPEHLSAAKRVLRYLQGTKMLGIIFSGGKNVQNTTLTGYSDSDWGGDPDTRRSTTAYLFKFGGGPISWSSRLQPTVALSSAEAEYMAASAAVQEATYLRQLLSEFGYQQSKSTTIFEDNQGCIALARNPVLHKRTKHIEIKYHFIRERIESGEIDLIYISTQKQQADILTKALPKPQFERLRTVVMGHALLSSGGPGDRA